MERFLQYALTGLSAGSLYALVALGLVLIYRSTRVLNFAHGEIATVGTFIAFSVLSRHHSFPVALALSLAAGAALGAAFYLGILVPAQRRGANLLGMVILTLGLALVIQGVVVYTWGAEPDALPFPISDTRTYQLGGVVVSLPTRVPRYAAVGGTPGFGSIDATSTRPNHWHRYTWSRCRITTFTPLSGAAFPSHALMAPSQRASNSCALLA